MHLAERSRHKAFDTAPDPAIAPATSPATALQARQSGQCRCSTTCTTLASCSPFARATRTTCRRAAGREGLGVGVRFGVVPVTCPLLTVNELEAAFQNLDSMRWCMAVKRRGRCLSFNEPAAHLPLLGRTAGLPASQGGSQGQGGPCTSNAGRGTAGAAHGAWRRRRRPRRPRRRAAGKRWPSHAPLGAAGRHALLTSPKSLSAAHRPFSTILAVPPLPAAPVPAGCAVRPAWQCQRRRRRYGGCQPAGGSAERRRGPAAI